MYRHTLAIAALLAASPSALPAESFPAYRAYEDTAPADWRALNERMRALGGHRGHLQADAASATPASPGPASATAGAPASSAGSAHEHGATPSPAPGGTPDARGSSSGHSHGHMPMHGHGHHSMHGHRHSPKEKP